MVGKSYPLSRFSTYKLGAITIPAHRITGIKQKNWIDSRYQFRCSRTLWGGRFGAAANGILCRLRFLKSKLDHKLLTGTMEDSGWQEGSGPALPLELGPIIRYEPWGQTANSHIFPIQGILVLSKTWLGQLPVVTVFYNKFCSSALRDC